MSGDVQPRKRKDKKKKKDELGIEEPRGTAAVLGEGDVFMHSQHDHGTGGHWCAKIIFFSLLAVLITLIGLIILENRGLTELEANSVETKYSGVLEGWLEDAPDDDHHDEHTLELKHPDDDGTEELHDVESDHEDEEDQEHDMDEEHDDDDENTESNEGDDDDDDDEEEQDHGDDEEEKDDDEEEQDNDNYQNEDDDESLEEADDEEVDEKIAYSQYRYDEQKYSIDDNDEELNHESREIEEEDDDDLRNEMDDDNDQSEDDIDEDSDDEQDDDEKNDEQIDDDSDDDSNKYEENEQDDTEEHDNEENQEEDDDNDNDEEEEIEKIEKEVSDDDEDSEEIPLKSSFNEEKDRDASKEDALQEEDEDEDDEDYLEADDDEPPIERITTPPAGKPFVEIEEETTEKPIDTLAEEEEYERRQEELRREEAQASHMWLKLAVGGALLVATHAVLRRATAPRDTPEPEENIREETPPLTDRRMTLISEEHSVNVSQERPSLPEPREVIEEEIFKKPAPVIKSAPVTKQDIEREVIEIKTPVQEVIPADKTKDEEEKELYSDEEEEVEEEEEEEEEEEHVVLPIRVNPQQKAPVVAAEQKEEESEPEEVPDDVEIIDDEQIEEEEEEDEDEEDISDVDDTELLNRLEAKYGRLPEPERPGKHKEGGNSIEDEWPGEPSESYWREQLDIAEEELRQGAWASCEKRVAVSALADSARARWITARALDQAAEAKRDNRILSKAITAYLHLLKMNERLSDKKLLEIAHRAIDRIQFRGTYLNAEPIYRLLIRRFPDDVNYRNNLTVSFLMANRADLADEVLKETLSLWPTDRVALAHHGFVLKNHYNKLEEAVVSLYKALEGDAGPANEPRFYYHLGDALLQLGRSQEAHEVHARGAELGHFLSPAQRSLYNVPRLRGRPWWPVEETPYVKLARALESSWREILKEGEAAKALFEQEKEGLKERGEWSQLDLFVRGRELPGRCKRAPATCAAVLAEPAAAGCRRGQVKFSAMRAGTHVRAHVGPTNCRLRLHLALSNTDNTYIRVHNETRQWQIGKTFIFDDSFEHEVWHNGTGTRLVLIVDVWHPDLTPAERRQLPAI